MIAQALTDDLHRPRVEGMQETMSITIELVYALKNIKKWTEPEEVETPPLMTGGKSVVYSKPKGVVLIICPFNFPVALTFQPLIGAIAAGNCCVLKPSELTPNCAKVIQHIVEKHLDSSAIRVVQGGVHETGELLKLPFDHFFYTGSGRVGKIVMKAAAEHLSTCTLELGGKSPVYIHEDANLDVTARRLIATKYLNDGQVRLFRYDIQLFMVHTNISLSFFQICIAPDYLLVNERVKDQLVERLKSTLEKFYGNSKDGMARLVNEHHFDRVRRMLEEPHGGQVVEGGLERADRKQKYIPPTFVLSPSLTSQMMTEEIFGPVLPIIPVKGVQQAVDIVGKKDNPLAAYVFTENDQVADSFLGQVQSGCGCVNDAISQIQNPGLPFGGKSLFCASRFALSSN